MAIRRTAMPLLLLLIAYFEASAKPAGSTCTGGRCAAGVPVLLQRYSRRDAPVVMKEEVEEEEEEKADEDEETLTPSIREYVEARDLTIGAGLGPATGEKMITSLNGVRLSHFPIDITKRPLLRPAHWGHELPMPDHWGKTHFLSSAEVFDWSIFAVAAGVAVVLRQLLHEKEVEDRFWGHALAFLCWIILAAIFAAAVLVRFGEDAAADWVAGYHMEMFFMIENVFVFRSVIHALELDNASVVRTLSIVAWGQIAFEAVFFMGLAHHLRTWRVLPHVLGLTLLYFGGSTLVEAFNHSKAAAGPSATSPVASTILESTFVSNLARDQTEASSFIVHKDNRWQLSITGFALGALLLTDFMFEIDTVLTKVEEIENPFVAFSSSALAAFALPELFMLSQDALFHFPLLKYGIGIVLCLFGVLMMLAPVVVLQPSLTVAIMLGILLTSMLLSELHARLQPHWGEALSDRGQ
eukprot:TRINITY_DN11327_c0_g1_i1.p1 TRINITY_DN11327_c0_g1~~TRINITY_DN11327_c0_g1_i1.p1  ORF type:complete len:468 (-),score=101.83 TRINITY_DN11327_c0_g1_i1:382-1785(-)